MSSSTLSKHAVTSTPFPRPPTILVLALLACWAEAAQEDPAPEVPYGPVENGTCYACWEDVAELAQRRRELYRLCTGDQGTATDHTICTGCARSQFFQEGACEANAICGMCKTPFEEEHVPSQLRPQFNKIKGKKFCASSAIARETGAEDQQAILDQIQGINRPRNPKNPKNNNRGRVRTLQDLSKPSASTGRRFGGSRNTFGRAQTKPRPTRRPAPAARSRESPAEQLQKFIESACSDPASGKMQFLHEAIALQEKLEQCGDNYARAGAVGHEIRAFIRKHA